MRRLRDEGLGIGLATVVVGDEYSSAAYERRLRRHADELGVPYLPQALPVDATQDDVGEAWRTVRRELEAYGEDLAGKPEILALNKIDALDAGSLEAKAAELEAAAGAAPRRVSGVAGVGVTELLREAWRLVRARRAEAAAGTGGPERPGEWRP